MKDLASRVTAAEQAMLFLAFIPGTPSIHDLASVAQRANIKRFVRGCVTSPVATGEFYYTLRGTSPPKKQGTAKGQPKKKRRPVEEEARVISAEALDEADAPGGWLPNC